MDVESVRRFLDGYENGDRYVGFEDEPLPEWLRDRVPVEQDSNVTPLEEYDFKSKTDPGVVQEGASNVSAVERREAKEQIWAEATDGEGFEAYAWYVPFHYSPRRFGIYVREEGIQLLGHLLYAWNYDSEELRRAQVDSGIATGRMPDDLPVFEDFQDAARLALEIFLRHEWYHHQVELLAAYLEDIRDETFYEDYHAEIYQEEFPDGDCIEESLANAYVFKSRACANRAPSQDVFRLLFHLSTASQPSAYQAYHAFRGDDFRIGGSQLAKAILTQDPDVLNRSSLGRSEMLHLGRRLPLDTNLHSRRGSHGVPVYVLESNRTPPSLAYFDVVQLETDYDIVTTEEWDKSYSKADNTMEQHADNLIEKLQQNVNHSGFNWRNCGGGLQYGRLNQQFRFVARRDDSDRTIELVDFGHHDLPKKYGCY